MSNVKGLSITSVQIRSARAALGWSADDLARQSGISLRTILRLERADQSIKVRSSTIILVRQALEDAGIEFIGKPDEGPGIRYWPRGEKTKD